MPNYRGLHHRARALSSRNACYRTAWTTPQIVNQLPVHSQPHEQVQQYRPGMPGMPPAAPPGSSGKPSGPNSMPERYPARKKRLTIHNGLAKRREWDGAATFTTARSNPQRALVRRGRTSFISSMSRGKSSGVVSYTFTIFCRHWYCRPLLRYSSADNVDSLAASHIGYCSTRSRYKQNQVNAQLVVQLLSLITCPHHRQVNTAVD